MAVSKVTTVDENGEETVLIDTSETTVTASTLAEGVTAVDANGDTVTGTMVTEAVPLEVNTEEAEIEEIDLSMGENKVFTGSTSDADGAYGLVPAPSAGDEEKFLRGDGGWEEVTTSVFSGATSSEAGSAGLVTAPSAGDQTKFLCGDGTWKEPEGVSAPKVYHRYIRITGSTSLPASTTTTVASLKLRDGYIWVVTAGLSASPSSSSSSAISAFLNYSSSVVVSQSAYYTGTNVRRLNLCGLVDTTEATVSTEVTLTAYTTAAYKTTPESGVYAYINAVAMPSTDVSSSGGDYDPSSSEEEF